MQVTIKCNGSLQLIISEPKGPVEAAALKLMREAVGNSQKVRLASEGEAIVLELVR